MCVFLGWLRRRILPEAEASGLMPWNAPKRYVQIYLAAAAAAAATCQECHVPTLSMLLQLAHPKTNRGTKWNSSRRSSITRPASGGGNAGGDGDVGGGGTFCAAGGETAFYKPLARVSILCVFLILNWRNLCALRVVPCLSRGGSCLLDTYHN